MTRRTMNFYAGPAALPLAALERARDELVDFEGTGMSIMEHSHRGAAYEGVHREAIALLEELLTIPDTHRALLLQGGARQQFAMVPMNLLRRGRSADYVVTGTWARQALSEARYVGSARRAGSTEAEGFTRVPAQDELELDPAAAYVHVTSNNTLFGTQYSEYPDTGEVPLVVDMTSDLLSRPIDISRLGLVYAGAQKNVGPAGVTVVIVRKELIESARDDIPQVFRYASHAAKDSLWNTPPTFAIYMLRNTLAVLKELGGVAGLAERNAAKARAVYEAIDAHPDFFRCPVPPGSRSTMNAVFRLPDEGLEKRFVAEAAEAWMVGVRGHRSVGGIRISMYNAVEPAWVDAVVGLMDSFRHAHA